MKNKEKTEFIHIRLSDKLHQRLKVEAALKRTSMTELVGKAAEYYLKNNSLVSNQ